MPDNPADQAPINDTFDEISAFMAAPAIMQQALVMILCAARDLPETDRAQAELILDRAAAFPQILPGAQHFLSIVNCVTRDVAILRFNGEWTEPEG